jgi:hypothetical protein
MKHDWFPNSGGNLIKNLWLANALKVALLKPTFVPAPDTQTSWGMIAADEITGPGYTAGGVLLANKTGVYDPALDRTNLLADDSVWNAATFDTGFAVIYDTGAGNPLWSLVDFEGVKSVVGGVFTIDWAAVGALYVTKV